MPLRKSINYLSDYPAINLLIALVYYLLVVLPHEQVGKFCAWLFDSRMTRDDYNLIILLVSISGLLLYLTVVLNNIRNKTGVRNLVLYYLAASVLFTFACFKLLMVINIEAIHFVQYGVMAILLFPLVKKYGETACWVMLLGAMDEAWQYFYLAPQRTNYYDFNDVVINLTGCGFGLILMRSLCLEIKPSRNNHFFRSPAFYTLAILTLLLFAAFQMEWLKVGPLFDHSDPLWVLIRVPQISFWTIVHPNVKFHVIQPLEGLIILGSLLIFYAGLEPPPGPLRRRG